ncbi:MAG: AMP-binding protein, partial [Planctomycetota bacterium]|nr:AMP-binding protein [Planctomycetota bacterium]
MADIENFLKEERSFPPPVEFAGAAVLGNAAEVDAMRRTALEDPEGFWERVAERLPWFDRWHTVLDWEPPFAKWFVGGKINASTVCLDAHLEDRGTKTAILWEGEPGEVRAVTYAELHEEVCRLANALEGLGVAAGDRVAIYMPMVPELAASLLACARIGATHSVVFGGFSADALRDRIQDMQAKCVITADGGFRKGEPLPLKPAADEAIAQCPTVKHQIVLHRAGNQVDWTEGRDHDYAELVAAASRHHEAVPLDAEHPLFTLY